MQQLGMTKVSRLSTLGEPELKLTVTILCMTAGGELSSTISFQISSGPTLSSVEEDRTSGAGDGEVAGCSSGRKASLKLNGNEWETSHA